MPVRPSVPPLWWAAAAFWIGLSLAEAVAWRAHTSAAGTHAWWLAAGGAAGSAALAGVLARRRWGASALVALGLAAGLAVGGLFWARSQSDAASICAAGSRRWRVEVTGDAVAGQFGSRSPGRIIAGTGAGAAVAVDWPPHATAPMLGQEVEALGTVKAGGTDKWGRRAHRDGVAGSLRSRQVRVLGWAHTMRGAVGPLRARAAERLSTAAQGPGGDLLASVLLGDKRRLAGTPAEEEYRTAGLSHLVSTSGMHLVVIAGVLSWALGLSGLPRLARAILVAGFMCGFATLTGLHPSVVRACVMASAGALAWQSGRRADSLAAVGVAAIAMLAASPSSAFDVGFALSIAGVAGIVVFARLAEAWLRAAAPRALHGLSAPLALSVTAQAATVPPSAATFGMVSLVSPLANLVAMPIVGVATVWGVGALLAGAAAPGMDRALLGLDAWLAARVAWVAHALASWPHAAIPVTASAAATCALGALVAGVAWATWPAPTRRRARVVALAAAICLSLVACGPRPSAGPQIVALDIGQGDAILIRDGAHALLVDTGPTPTALKAALVREEVRSLDGVVITHLHDDHYGGLPGLAGVVRVPFVAFPSGSLASRNPAVEDATRLSGSGGLRELRAGDRLTVGSFTADVLWPRDRVADCATNEASVVLLVRRGNFSAVLTGDAEGQILDDLIRRGELGRIDVLKVGHHGSAGAISGPIMAVLRPAASVISVGAGNRFGHPTPSTMRELERSATRIFRTDQSGDVEVLVGERGFSVRTLKHVALGAIRTDPVSVAGLGAVSASCATLTRVTFVAPRHIDPSETDGFIACRPQAGLPHLRDRGPPARAGPRAAEEDGRRGRRPRLQHGHVRWRERERRRRHRGVQYAAVRF